MYTFNKINRTNTYANKHIFQRYIFQRYANEMETL